MKKKGNHRPRNSAQYERVAELLIMHKAKMDIETHFVVTVGFTTKVDHQTTSKISRGDVLSFSTFEETISMLGAKAFWVVFRIVFFFLKEFLRKNQIKG